MTTSQGQVGVATGAPASRPFLRHVHDFRAFAILAIVAAHSWRLPNGVVDAGLKAGVDDLRQGLTHDSTIYFVLVSGLLLFHLGIQGNPVAWFRRRVTNVALPFVVVSTVIVVAARWDDGAVAVVRRLGRAIVQGDAQFHLWYIPWVMAVFAISPLLVRIPRPWFGRLTAAAVLVPLVVSRTGTSVTLSQYGFLLPVYLVGGWIALQGDDFRAWYLRWRWAIVGAAVLTGVVVLLDGNAPWPVAWFDAKESVFYVHRLTLSVLVLEGLRRVSHLDLPLVDVIARHSFAIYFLHLTVWRILWPRWTDAIVAVEGWLVVPASFLLGPVVLLLTLAVTVTISRLVGPRSKYLIGA